MQLAFNVQGELIFPKRWKDTERHAPARQTIDGSIRCEFCGFAWLGHPQEIQDNPDILPELNP